MLDLGLIPQLHTDNPICAEFIQKVTDVRTRHVVNIVDDYAELQNFVLQSSATAKENSTTTRGMGNASR